MSNLPHDLEKRFRHSAGNCRPAFLSGRTLRGRRALARLLKRHPSVVVVDRFEDQLRELFLSRHPELRVSPGAVGRQVRQFIQSCAAREPLWQQGAWVYFDWSNILVHLLDQTLFFELRTSRNHDLITKDEQEKFKNFRIGIVGLSVGSSVAIGLALEGAGMMRLADFDELALSNLNRVHGGVHQLGLNKAVLAARQIYELNPYLNLELYTAGIRRGNIRKFVAGPPPLDLLVDEADDVALKVQLRLAARRLRIPVLSSADNGDGSIADVERFDLEPRRAIFHGAVRPIDAQRVSKGGFGRRLALINKMVGVEYVTPRMKESLLKVGREIYAWPQLGGAALLSGAVIAYLARKIALDEPLPSGKYDVNLDRIFMSGYNSVAARRKRDSGTGVFLARQKHLFSDSS